MLRTLYFNEFLYWIQWSISSSMWVSLRSLEILNCHFTLHQLTCVSYFMSLSWWILVKNDVFIKIKGTYIDRYLKNGVSKSIFHVIKHVDFRVYRAHPDGVISKNWQLTTNIYEWLWFLYIKLCLSAVLRRKKSLRRNWG